MKRKSPGYRNSHFGLNRSRKRKWRQPSRQLRRCGGRDPAVGRERGRHFGDVETLQRRLDDHLAREFHARGLKIEVENGIAGKATQAAMEVAARALEEDAADRRQYRIAEIAVQGGHGARPYSALEAIAHHQVVSLAQLLHEGVEFAEVVTVVAVAHDDIGAAGGADARHQGAAIALCRHVDHRGAMLPGDRPRAIGAAVVGNDDFAVDAAAREIVARLLDAARQRLRLVEAGHQDGQFARCRHHGAPAGNNLHITSRGAAQVVTVVQSDVSFSP